MPERGCDGRTSVDTDEPRRLRATNNPSSSRSGAALGTNYYASGDYGAYASPAYNVNGGDIYNDVESQTFVAYRSGSCPARNRQH